MTRRLAPLGRIRARFRVPGDKSISHRALILNALAEGSARVRGLAPGLDVRSTAAALRGLGAEIELDPRGDVRVRGPCTWRAERAIDCANSGTTARLLLGLLAPRASAPVLVDGDGSLRRRPMERAAAPLRTMGAEIVERGAPGRLPLEVVGRPLAGRRHRLEVASAQVKSAILLAGLAAEGETELVEPFPSRDHSERMLRAMGARVAAEGSRVTIAPGPIAPLDVHVPGDPSSAAFFLALAAASGGEVTIDDVALNPRRAGFAGLLVRMGADVETVVEAEDVEPRGTIVVRADGLRGIDVRPEEVPGAIDELPLLAVVATQARGETRVTGAAELRVKESDRIETIAEGLVAMGADVRALSDGFVVTGPVRLSGAALDARGDHRIAMALAVAAALARGPSMLTGAEWVDVSYPGFFDALAACEDARVTA